MAGTRTTISGVGGRKFPSKTPGDITGLSLNTFGLDKLQAGINGELLAEILMVAIGPAEEQAKEEWPKETHASVETIKSVVTEVGPKMARVALVVGGPELINDPRNKKHIDYAPYIEFNGSPGGTPPGTLTHAMAANEVEMKRIIRVSVAQLIEDLLV